MIALNWWPHASDEFSDRMRPSQAGEGKPMVCIEDFDRFAFIVGAPRCGTTTIANSLKTHPAVAFPIVKEPHFFAQNDLRTLSDGDLRSRVEREYLRRFYTKEKDRRVGVDASVTYLYTPEHLEPILRLWPHSRFVVAIRNPLAMLPSLHQRLIYTGDETIPSFKDAWAAVVERAAGRGIPRCCVDPRWLRYDQAARFGTYLERLFAAVGRERCFVLLFDDLVAEPRHQYEQLMRFIDIDALPKTGFAACRQSRRVRSRWLQRLLKRPPVAVRTYLAGAQFNHRHRDLDAPEVGVPKAVLSLRKRLLSWNRVSSPPQPVPADLQSEIRHTLAGEVEKLGSILGRDLGHWLSKDREAFKAPTAPTDRSGMHNWQSAA
jgi:hypothetical protein